MIYLKLVPTDFKKESRDKRELSIARELGYEICVIDRTKEEKGFRERYEDYDVLHISTRRLGRAAWLHAPNRVLAFLDYIVKTIQIDADIISGHDYIALLAGYIANCFKRRKAKIIYDSHEFELYRYAPNRTSLQRKIIRLVEGYLLRHVDLVLMVSDNIADGVQKIYGLMTRPTVVRNIPAYWKLDMEKTSKIRHDFFNHLGLSEDGFLIMYHGSVAESRGIEYAVHALAELPKDIGLVILGGDNENGMVKKLEQMARKIGVSERVLFRPAVSVSELKDYIGAVDVEVVLQSAQVNGSFCINILYSLPNKFFESIQACVPIICCDLPEMGAIIRQYDIGLLVHEDDGKSVAEAILRLKEEKKLYARLKDNMNNAKNELCWEQESLRLKNAIRKMRGGEMYGVMSSHY